MSVDATGKERVGARKPGREDRNPKPSAATEEPLAKRREWGKTRKETLGARKTGSRVNEAREGAIEVKSPEVAKPQSAERVTWHLRDANGSGCFVRAPSLQGLDWANIRILKC